MTQVLKGTDGRMYALEAMRLTPRDANYVKGAKGTKNIPPSCLSPVDENIAMTYVLRHELVSIYAQHKATAMRQEMMQEDLKRKIAKEAPITTPTPIVSNPSPIVSPTKRANGKGKGKGKGKNGKGGSGSEEKKNASEGSEEQKGDKEEDKKEVKKEEKEQESEEPLSNEQKDMERYAITNEQLGLELNPNCFIAGMECDVNPLIVLKDEETAKTLASFLYNETMLSLTEQIRIGSLCPFDNESLVDLCHSHGVNMRYLGRLAKLAVVEEHNDEEVREKGEGVIE